MALNAQHVTKDMNMMTQMIFAGMESHVVLVDGQEPKIQVVMEQESS